MPQTDQRIGQIRLLERLGEGGMGTVWRGYDEKLRRDVAVKSLRGDLLNLGGRARLLIEARILSQLEHPNICRLYDYIEGEGNDYLVLELIRGRTLAEAAGELTPAAKLRIAEDIAQTLVVAHARGIVHRDLKPSNVMLSDDGGDQVKVLDFGLARSVETGAGEGQAQTFERLPTQGELATKDTLPSGPTPSTKGTLTRLGSLALKSEVGRVSGTPAYMSPEQARGEQATPASDMYSFGLMLQELFTGKSAYAPDLHVGMLLTKAADGDTLPIEGVRSDLQQLIEALLTLAPEARPAASEAVSALRRIRERPKRIRRWVTVTALFSVSVLGALKYTYDQQEALHEQQLALEREAEAREEAEQATAFLLDLFVNANPLQRPTQPTLLEVLEYGRGSADELAEHPRIQGRLLKTLGEIYAALARHGESESILREALEVNRVAFGPESTEFVETLAVLGEVIHRQGRYDEAEARYVQALELRESRPELADAGAQAELLYNLANIYDERGDPTRPAGYYDRALALLGQEPGVHAARLSTLLMDMGTYYRRLGQFERAESLYRRSLTIREYLGVPAAVVEVLSLLGKSHVDRGELEEAESLFRRAIEVGDQVVGEEHPMVSRIRRNLGIALLHAGELEAAQAPLVHVERVQGPEARKDDVALWTHVRASIYTRQGRYAEAASLHEVTAEGFAEVHGEGHARVGRMLAELARNQRDQGDALAAEQTLERAVAILEKALDADNRDLVDVRLLFAEVALERGAVDRALELVQQARESTRRNLSEVSNARDRGRLAAAALCLGELSAAKGANAEAEGHWSEVLTILEPHEPMAEMRQTRALALLRLGRAAEARPLVDALVAKGWRDPRLIASAQRAGLLLSVLAEVNPQD